MLNNRDRFADICNCPADTEMDFCPLPINNMFNPLNYNNPIPLIRPIRNPQIMRNRIQPYLHNDYSININQPNAPLFGNENTMSNPMRRWLDEKIGILLAENNDYVISNNELIVECNTNNANGQIVNQFNHEVYFSDNMNKDIAYVDIFKKVWKRIIDNNENKVELIRILNEQLRDSIGRCITGKMSRLISVLSGFYDDMEMNVSDQEFLINLVINIKNKYIEGSLNYRDTWKQIVEIYDDHKCKMNPTIKIEMDNIRSDKFDSDIYNIIQDYNMNILTYNDATTSMNSIYRYNNANEIEIKKYNDELKSAWLLKIKNNVTTVIKNGTALLYSISITSTAIMTPILMYKLIKVYDK